MTHPDQSTPAPASGGASASSGMAPLTLAFAVGIAVSLGLGLYGRLHDPTGQAINIAGFSSGIAAKAALTTVAALLGLVQLVSAMAMYGRLPLKGRWLGPAHRWSGRAAVAVTVPVAVHCLYALGIQTFDARVALHSLLGCFFYGAFVAKMLVLTRDDSPRWALPLLGGLTFAGLTMLWFSASLWYYLTVA